MDLDGLGIARTISRFGVKASFDKRFSTRLKQNETKQDNHDQRTEIRARGVRFWGDSMYSAEYRYPYSAETRKLPAGFGLWPAN